MGDHVRQGLMTLPVRLVPLSGEAPEGFAARLAVANFVTGPELNAWISPAGVAVVRGAQWISALERAASLPMGFFQRARRRHLLYATCHHYGWRRMRCVKCDIIDVPRTGCIRCAGGEPTTVFARGGAVCVRHRRWHHDGLDIDLRGRPDYAHAEARMSGWLWFHGVTLHTGEFELATALVIAAVADNAERHRRTRLRRLMLDDHSGISPLLLFYPEITDLTCALTDPAVASALCTHRERPERQAQMLIGLAVGASGGAPTAELATIASQEVGRMRQALRCAFSMPSSKNATVRRAQRPKALIEAAHRYQAVLIRHVDEVRLNAPYIANVKPPPSPRVVSRRIQTALNRAIAARN